jgi:hypothetical protein
VPTADNGVGSCRGTAPSHGNCWILPFKSASHRSDHIRHGGRTVLEERPQRDAKTGPLARRAINTDLPAVIPDDAVGDGEPETNAVCPGCEERVEDLLQAFRGDTAAGIADNDFAAFAFRM